MIFQGRVVMRRISRASFCAISPFRNSSTYFMAASARHAPCMIARFRAESGEFSGTEVAGLASPGDCARSNRRNDKLPQTRRIAFHAQTPPATAELDSGQRSGRGAACHGNSTLIPAEEHGRRREQVSHVGNNYDVVRGAGRDLHQFLESDEIAVIEREE